MRRDLFDGFAVVVIHLELLLFVGGIRHFPADDNAFFKHRLAKLLADIRRRR